MVNQSVPFQCSISVISPYPLVKLPTAKQSVGERHVTWLSTPSTSSLGVNAFGELADTQPGPEDPLFSRALYCRLRWAVSAFASEVNLLRRRVVVPLGAAAKPHAARKLPLKRKASRHKTAQIEKTRLRGGILDHAGRAATVALPFVMQDLCRESALSKMNTKMRNNDEPPRVGKHLEHIYPKVRRREPHGRRQFLTGTRLRQRRPTVSLNFAQPIFHRELVL